jgi:hypothetical protein
MRRLEAKEGSGRGFRTNIRSLHKRFGETTMTATADAAASEAGRSGVGKIALASLVGTTIEFYDYSLVIAYYIMGSIT